MSHLIINGGKKLHGAIVNQSAKNSAVALLCASVMIKGETILSDLPAIEEVFRILELLKSIGVKVKKIGEKKYRLDASGPLTLGRIDRRACETTRSSLLLFGALAGRAKDYKIYKSGGCKLGERTVRPHLYALEKFGIKIISRDDYYEVVNPSVLKSGKVVMYESGDTATENAIMAAALAKGKTIIKMASANYMVQDLCHFLNKAGAEIRGVGTTTLEIEGVEELRPVRNYPVMPDPIAAMTFVAAAIVTGSTLTVKNCPLEFLELELCKLEKMGQRFQILKERKSKNGQFEIVDIKTYL